MGLRKNRRPGNRAMTRRQSARILAVKRGGCLCCIAKGYPHDPDGPMVEAHHLLEGGLRIGHEDTIGLCLWHHKGQIYVEGWDIDQHREWLGPSLAEGSVTFNAEWGSDDFLLEWQQERLGVLA